MINESWDKLLKEEYNKDYFKTLFSKVLEEHKKHTVFPNKENIFEAFKLTNYNNIKVLILGQDPYHGINQSHGLAFSVKIKKTPPSLLNIFKELKSDLNIVRKNNDLSDWAMEGVLLLNAILTVVENKPLSHQSIGWETFTDNVIKLINNKETPVVFILWGNYAKSKKPLITNPKHLIIESSHPSPLSAHHSFFGSKPFSKTNTFLKKNNIKEIKW